MSAESERVYQAWCRLSAERREALLGNPDPHVRVFALLLEHHRTGGRVETRQNGKEQVAK